MLAVHGCHAAWCDLTPRGVCGWRAARSPGQAINQNGKLFSANGQYFLTMTNFGSVTLYATALYAANSPQSTIFSSYTYSSNGPFVLTFQVSAPCKASLLTYTTVCADALSLS